MINIDNSSGRFFVQCHNDDNTEFVNRQKNVFEQLDAVMKNNEKNIASHNVNKRSRPVTHKDHSFKRQKSETRQFRGQESIFKRPEAPPPSRFHKNLPDYMRRPDKWTKYTLSDVSQEDMSDHSNTAAAMSFLRELRAKKEFEVMDIEGNTSHIAFKKPQRKRDVEISPSQEKHAVPNFKSSKVVMPEYVVGEKKISKKNVKKVGKPEKGKEIKLYHLNEDEGF